MGEETEAFLILGQLRGRMDSAGHHQGLPRHSRNPPAGSSSTMDVVLWFFPLWPPPELT